MKKSVIVMLFVLFSVAIVSAQGTPAPTPTQRDRNERNLEGRMTNLSFLDKAARQQAEEKRRNELLAKPVQPKMNDKFRSLMEVDPKIKAQFAGFSSSQTAGLVKLLSSEDCRVIREVGKIKKCRQQNANIRGFANAFSFREKSRTVFRKADIGLKDGYFVAGRHSVQTIVVDLGNTSIESVSLNTPGVSYLSSYNASTDEKAIDRDFDMFKTGLTVASFDENQKELKFSYGKIVKVKPDTTYVIRAISYRPPEAPALAKDQDVIVTFRVVKQDKNKAATIIWRELKRSEGKIMERAADRETK